MKKKLLLLNLVLLALVVVIGERVRQRWLEARKREAAVLGQPLEQLPPPPYAALAPVPPVKAAEYNDVAQQMLFSADRNPTVTVEVAPPPPMPKLPAYYGVVNIGDGPFAILSVEAGAEHKYVRFGENIGEFKLVSVEDDQVVFEWRGEKIVKKTTELVAKEQAAAKPRPPAAKPKPKPEPATSLVAPEKKSAPGIDVGASYRACEPGDTTPAGTVVDGYRKVERPTPFGGKVCQWVPVN